MLAYASNNIFIIYVSYLMYISIISNIVVLTLMKFKYFRVQLGGTQNISNYPTADFK